MRIGIVGCGTAGPAAALLLQRRGHSVELFDRVEAPKPVGAGILLQPTGAAVLAELGLLPRVLQRSAVVRKLYGATTSGRVVLDLAYADYAPSLYGMGVHRGLLFLALEEGLAAAGLVPTFGVDVVSLPLEGGRRSVVASDGRSFGPFDLVVLADGARSTLRGLFGGSASPYPWGALWAVMPTVPGIAADVLDQTYRDTRSMLGFLPTGLGPSGETPLVSLFWSVRANAVDDWRTRGLEAWKRDVLALQPRAAPLLDAIRDTDELVFAPYFDVRLPRWHADALVVLGDAGHAMSPQLGQGANLALFDAAVLAQSLALGEPLHRQLAAFSRARKDHLRFYQFASRWLTPFFQSSLPALAPLRDLFTAPLSRWGWFRRQMLGSLVGTKTGLFSSFPLPNALPPA